jgi:uncharacterized membrane protein YfhO
MINKFKYVIKTKYEYILSFLIPVIIIACYFSYRNMFPFGTSSILTVDLGQQYIDFFTYFRRTILSANMHNIVYSFSNGYGGGMIGIWAYYLLSPFNFILLLPKKIITGSVLNIILLKYGFSGLTFNILLKQKQIKSPLLRTTLSLSYALNGWIIANQINIMWLDGMVFLPLFILGIDHVIHKKSNKTLLITYTILIISNYYIAFMISIFGICYTFAEIIKLKLTLKRSMQIIIKLAYNYISAILLSAFILIPNIINLQGGKAAYTVNQIKWKWEYNPLYMLSKLVTGSFNFSQMPTGYPNIFIGSIAIIGNIIFIITPFIKIRTKICYSLLSLFLIVSMSYEPLDLLWHGMQFPIWYPYRFSFIFCFWTIYLAALGLNKMSNQIKVKQVISIAIPLITGMLFIIFKINHFQYLSLEKYLISLFFLTLAFLIINLADKKRKSYLVSLFIIASCEMGLNVFYSLNSISYVSNSDYTKYSNMLNTKIHQIQQNDKTFYRISKDFYRSRDDPMQANFAGGSTFSSTLQKSTPDFNNNIGNPYTSGSIDYSNGTLVTDSLLGFKYFIHANNVAQDYPMIQKTAFRYDIYQHDQNTQFQVYRSNIVLPILYTTNHKFFNQLYSDNPIDYQNKMVTQITGVKTPVFVKDDHFQIQTDNINPVTSLNQQLINKNSLLKSATMKIIYYRKKDSLPYLVLPASLNQQNCKIMVNNNDINVPSNFDSTLVISLPNQIKNTIYIQFNHSHTETNELSLYRLNIKRYTNETNYIRNQDNNIKVNKNQINATINTNQPNLITSVPYEKGWQLMVDGQRHPIRVINHEFIGADHLPKGLHRIKLSYYPVGLNAGIITSLMTLVLILILNIWKHNVSKRKCKHHK